MCGSATLVMDASTKSRNATAQSRIRTRLPRHVASVEDAEPAVIAVPPGVSEAYYVGITNVGSTNVGVAHHSSLLAGPTTVRLTACLSTFHWSTGSPSGCASGPHG